MNTAPNTAPKPCAEAKSIIPFTGIRSVPGNVGFMENSSVGVTDEEKSVKSQNASRRNPASCRIGTRICPL